MTSILTVSDLQTIFPLKKQKLVLVGGCFDILHIGHITFLESAKEIGDSLVVLLESDAKIKKTKGDNRPINSQSDRAKILSALRFVDYVILLPLLETAEEYDHLIEMIQPTVIATTNGDPAIAFKERSAARVGAKVVAVTNNISDQSTTKLISLFAKQNE